jgi:hypothetical protein
MNLRPIGANQTEITIESHYGMPIRILFSYSTPVAVSDMAGLCFVTDKFYSRTTSKHIKAWLAGRSARKESQAFINGFAEVR